MAKRAYPLARVYGLLEPGPERTRELAKKLVGCGNSSGRSTRR